MKNIREISKSRKRTVPKIHPSNAVKEQRD